MFAALFNPFNLAVLSGWAFLMLWEALLPARSFPHIPGFHWRGLASATLYVVMASWLPFAWSDWLGQYLVFDGHRLPFALQLVIGYAVVQFFAYWWHRAMHRFDWLWLRFHQMHHSVERMDSFGALYFHPNDTIGFTFAASFALTVIFGMDPLAAAIVAVFGGLAALFTHANVATPRWIGWIMQRPESHGRHHQRGRHTGNFAELVIWDQLFGTYENPREWNGESGFYDGASARVWDMLRFRDVSGQPGDSPGSLTATLDQAGSVKIALAAFCLTGATIMFDTLIGSIAGPLIA